MGTRRKIRDGLRMVLAALLLVGCSAWAMPLSAQVAAPELLPGTPRFVIAATTTEFYGANFTPDNPAAQQWHPGGRIAVGRSKLKSVYNPAPPAPQYTLAGETGYGGLVWIGERSGLSVGTMSLKVDWNNGSPSEQRHADTAALSAKPWDWLALGFGVNSTTVNSAVTARERNTAVIGTSTCWGTFCLGFADTTDRYTDPNDPTYTGVRKGNRWGLGFQGGESNRWHLEVSEITKKDFVTGFGPGPEPGYRLSQQMLEFNFSGWLISWRNYSTHLTGVSPADGDGWTTSFGWAPPDGLSIVGTMERGTWSGTGLDRVDEIHGSLSLGWEW